MTKSGDDDKMANKASNAALIILEDFKANNDPKHPLKYCYPHTETSKDGIKRLVLAVNEVHIIYCQAQEKVGGGYNPDHTDYDEKLAQLRPTKQILQDCYEILRMLGAKHIVDETLRTHSESVDAGTAKSWYYDKFTLHQSDGTFYTKKVTIPRHFSVPISALSMERIERIIKVADTVNEIVKNIQYIIPEKYRQSDKAKAGLYTYYKIEFPLSSDNRDEGDNDGEDKVSEAFRRLQYAKTMVRNYLEESFYDEAEVDRIIDKLFPNAPVDRGGKENGVYYHEIDFKKKPELAEIFLNALNREKENELERLKKKALAERDKPFRKAIDNQKIAKFGEVLQSLLQNSIEGVEVTSATRATGSGDIIVNFSDNVDIDAISILAWTLHRQLRSRGQLRDFYVQMIEEPASKSGNTPDIYVSTASFENTKNVGDMRAVKIRFVNIARTENTYGSYGAIHWNVLSPDELNKTLDTLNAQPEFVRNKPSGPAR